LGQRGHFRRDQQLDGLTGGAGQDIDPERLEINSVRHTYWVDKMISRCSSVIG